MDTFIALCVCVFALIGTAITQDRQSSLSRSHCGPVCYMACPNGFVLDHRGCPICRCRRPSGGRCTIIRSRGYSRRRFCFGSQNEIPCRYDWQCKWNQKCCFGPCGYVCVNIRSNRY